MNPSTHDLGGSTGAGEAGLERGNCCYRVFAGVASNVFILLMMFSCQASSGHRAGRYDAPLYII